MVDAVRVAMIMNQNDLEDENAKLRKQLAEALVTINGNIAAIDGLTAQVNALKQAHPNSPLLAASGQIWQRGQNKGQQKTKLRLIFEAAHDAALRKLGVSNPEQIRGN
ncbi:MAG: hypothetical protein FD119_135 [Stygiobacter sp.]|nr:MAG: hypothetical protein FD119_135 [Stygiobacter sp.]